MEAGLAHSEQAEELVEGEGGSQVGAWQLEET